MRYAFKTNPQETTWADMLAVWRAGDELDVFESAWNFDHFYPIFSDSSGPCMESWVTLSALAQATHRLRVGCMVNGVVYRHPAVLANMASTLDIVSGGRLELGLGAGWNEEECAAYGIELGSIKERFDRFEEALEVISMLTTQEWSDFQGRSYTLTRARNEPKGPQQPLPICIGGGGEKRLLPLVAKYAHHWNFNGFDIPTWQQKRAVLERLAAAEGRAPGSITTSVHARYAVGDDLGAFADTAAAWKDAGLDLMIVYLTPPHAASMLDPVAEVLRDVG